MRARHAQFPLIIFTIFGCHSASTLPGPIATDVADSQTLADSVSATDTDASVDSAPWTAPAIAPPDQGTAVVASSWLMASVNPTTDQVVTALSDGSLALPASGAKAYGVKWLAKSADTNGNLPAVGGNNTLQYALMTLHLDADRGVLMRADRAYDVWIDNHRQPGDIYGNGLLVPFFVAAGDHLVVVRGPGGQSLGVGLQTSTHEVKFNANDRTAPDFRVGDGGQRWLGVPLLVFGPNAAMEVTARVQENEFFAATATAYPALAAGAVSQVGFDLKPKQAAKAAGQTWTAHLVVDSPAWKASYEATIDLPTVATDANYRQTFLSPDDGSVQFYGVRPPLHFDASKSYALVESLHGAGVDAYGQVGAYSSRDWNWLIAATNRRPFGFDWEEWGAINAIASLDDATARFSPDPTRIYLAGHSMGGHGTWQVGVHFATRFAVLGPSAGWNDFYTYPTPTAEPKFPFSRARAHSRTPDFMGNLANRAVYVIHGTADNTVPWAQGQTMLGLAAAVTSDVDHHWEQGADHWWDGDEAPGADCVDWLDLFNLMNARRLDPTELQFHFTSPGPWYSPRYSYATIISNSSPLAHCELTSSYSGGALTLTTTNVRSLQIDGKSLLSKGISNIVVDGIAHPLTADPLWIGPQTGKTQGQTGPFNQVMHQPFLYVYPDGDEGYAAYAAWLVSTWSLIGNGHAGALPRSALTLELGKKFNIIYIGLQRSDPVLPADLPWQWDADGVHGGGKDFPPSLLLTVFVADGHLNALIVAPDDQRQLLSLAMPFSSRAGLPDYLVYGEGKTQAAGFYNGDWQLDPTFAVGL